MPSALLLEMDQHVNVHPAYSVIHSQAVPVLPINAHPAFHVQMVKSALAADVNIDVKMSCAVWAPHANRTVENVSAHRILLEIPNYCVCHVSKPIFNVIFKK